MNFSNVSPSHGLQLFTNCPSMGPFHGVQSFRNRLLQHGSPRGHKPCHQTCSSVGSSLHGSAGPGRSLLQRGAPHRATASFRHPPAPVWGPFHGLQVEICSTVDLQGLQGDSLPHHGLHHGLQGKTLCSGVWRTSSPPSLLTSAGLFLTHILTPVSTPLQFFSLLPYFIPEVPPQ